jgi:basic amino acid/polyamine antiporter, APA family
VPMGAIIVCGCMMIGLPLATWIRFAAWLALGLGIYAMYGRHRAPNQE